MPSPAAPKITYAPGARVVIRDEEWIVRSVRSATYGGAAVHVTGTSELVRGKNAIFLSELDEIHELRPEETAFAGDDSPQYRRSRLYLESLLRRTPPTDTALYAGHRGAIERADYQLQPARKALAQPRPRILMADGVGLGKTIEVGVLLSELIRRGRADRILVVALKSILAQFQEEMWARFTIPLVRLDSVGIQRVQTRIPSNMNPFYFYDRVIISIDTLKKDAKYRRYLEQSRWDVVVVDECQNVAVRNTGVGGKSQRARLAQLLARTSDALVLTSATPHDGKPESFASLMNLLEPTAVADESEYTREEVEDLFLRRFKKDIAHEVAEQFQERHLQLYKEDASSAENEVLETLSTIAFKTVDRSRRTKGALFRTSLLKSFLSSPDACLSTVRNRLGHKDVEDTSDPAVAHDREVLGDLESKVEAVKTKDFRKYVKLLDLLRGWGFDDDANSDRIVIFSERIATLEFLRERLAKDLGIGKTPIQIFHGSLDDQDQKRLVKDFGTKSTPIRILLASDAASEGINLHYFCHRLIHFDLPWSLITLNQRNGRIDRYGQKHRPEIGYLLTIPGDPKLKGDLRVLERLIEREDAASKNLGDVAWLMGLHEAEMEEERIARGIESGETPEDIVPEEAAHTDFMTMIFGDDVAAEPPPVVHDPLSLYSGELDYTRDALDEILGDERDAHVEWHDHLEGLTLRATPDFAKRCEYLPDELRTKDWQFKLTVNRERVMKALEASREHEGKWPEWQLLWEQHPVAEWINDRVLACFERHEAPVLRVQRGLEPGERVIVCEGVYSNARNQTLLVDWFGVRLDADGAASIRPMDDLVHSTGLAEGIANPGRTLDEDLLDALHGLRQPAVNAASAHMKRLRIERMEDLARPLREGLRKLRRWKDATVRNIDARKAAHQAKGTIRKDIARRLRDERHRAEKLYEGRQRWIEEGMKTASEDPYLRIAAVLIREES